MASQFCLTSSGPDTRDVAEDVRMTPLQLVDDAACDIVDGVAGAVGSLLRDPGVEHDLQQHVAEFLADLGLVACGQRVDRLVGLLKQVRRQALVRLPGVPRAVDPQRVHHLHELEQPPARRRVGSRRRRLASAGSVTVGTGASAGRLRHDGAGRRRRRRVGGELGRAGHHRVAAVVEDAELRIHLHAEALGRHALGVRELALELRLPGCRGRRRAAAEPALAAWTRSRSTGPAAAPGPAAARRRPTRTASRVTLFWLACVLRRGQLLHGLRRRHVDALLLRRSCRRCGTGSATSAPAASPGPWAAAA